LLAAVFLRSPLFSDSVGVMSLKMSLAASILRADDRQIVTK
jgi:hypothetical protein